MGLMTVPQPADVFVTAELDSRAAKARDYLEEKQALQDLAGHMVDRPEEVLPRFVDLAMQITGGVSAGLSLYEQNPAPGIFRWQYLKGILAPFEGATTPRDFSPCGVTLDQNGPVLSAHPERVYSWIADADIVVPEVLLVPLTLSSKVPLGTLWIVADREGHFDRGHATAMTELATFVGFALRMLQTERKLQHALEEQETLTKEMGHRVKNLFAMADGLLRLSARRSETKEDLVEGLSGRLHALAQAHTLVRRNFSNESEEGRAFELSELVRAVVRPHETSLDLVKPRFSMAGPLILCGDHAINGVALIFHELATNAAKYGALTRDEGRVDVSWAHDGQYVVIRWSELGGPLIAKAPSTKGFGGTLVEKTIVGQFGGEQQYEWLSLGLVVTFKLPLDTLSS